MIDTAATTSEEQSREVKSIRDMMGIEMVRVSFMGSEISSVFV
jgi:hypothetical protein